MVRIDAHLHVFASASEQFPREPDDLAPAGRAEPVEKFIGCMEEHDVDQAMLVQMGGATSLKMPCCLRFWRAHLRCSAAHRRCSAAHRRCSASGGAAVAPAAHVGLGGAGRAGLERDDAAHRALHRRAGLRRRQPLRPQQQPLGLRVAAEAGRGAGGQATRSRTRATTRRGLSLIHISEPTRPY